MSTAQSASVVAPDDRWLDDRNFERLVNADVRDRKGIGAQYALLRRKENRVRWLQMLIQIQHSIMQQSAQDNAYLKAHPSRATNGVPAESYLVAKKAVEERKAVRGRALRAVTERIGEARRLIGSDPLSDTTAGRLAASLVQVDLLLEQGDVASARRRVAGLLRLLGEGMES